VARTLTRLPRLRPAELAELIAQGAGLAIVDVRAAARIIIYCACPNDVSVLKAAHRLLRRRRQAQVLLGGIDGWVNAGYPLQAL
jgi:hypothetical protein